MVVYYSTPRQVRQQHAECRREEERARKARAHFWRDLDADMERARVRGEYFDTQMACKYGWNEKARSEATAEIKRLRKIQEEEMVTETRAEKAQRLVDEGRVRMIWQNELVTEGRVTRQGVGRPYHTFLYGSGHYAPGSFVCNCPWGRDHSYTDDLCAHALAVKLAMEKER